MGGDGDDNVAGDWVPSAPSDMSVTSRKSLRSGGAYSLVTGQPMRKRQHWNNISY